MDDIKFTIPTVPVAQPRARAVSIGGHARIYEAPASDPVHGFKATCRMAAADVYQGPPIEGPIYLTALFIMPRPTSLMWCKNPKRGKPKPMVRLPKDNGKDLDNLLKALLDALNGTLWRDDRQVYRIDAQKLIAAGDEQPHVEVILWRESEP